MNKRTLVASIATAGLVGGLALPAATSAGERTRFVSFATLNGAAEVPGPGDPDGRGFAVIRVDTEDGEICYNLFALRIQPATMAHIHEGSPDEAGPVVQDLKPPTNRISSGCVKNDELADDLAENPDDYYINVHNAEFPGGAVRGQLR